MGAGVRGAVGGRRRGAWGNPASHPVASPSRPRHVPTSRAKTWSLEKVVLNQGRSRIRSMLGFRMGSIVCPAPGGLSSFALPLSLSLSLPLPPSSPPLSPLSLSLCLAPLPLPLFLPPSARKHAPGSLSNAPTRVGSPPATLPLNSFLGPLPPRLSAALDTAESARARHTCLPAPPSATDIWGEIPARDRRVTRARLPVRERVSPARRARRAVGGGRKGWGAAVADLRRVSDRVQPGPGVLRKRPGGAWAGCWDTQKVRTVCSEAESSVLRGCTWL